MQLGRAEEGDEVVRSARELFGEMPELVVLAARAELREGRAEEAEAMLLPLASSGDDVARAAWSWIAVARLERGEEEGAISAAEQALTLDRNDPVATMVVGLALRNAGDPRALSWLERAKLLAPKAAEFAEELARARADLEEAGAPHH